MSARSCSAEMHARDRLRMPLVRDRVAWLEHLCATTHSGEVAHIGCADSPYTDELLARGVLLHQRLVRVGKVTGIDTDEQSLHRLRLALPTERFVNTDIAVRVSESERRRYELVIAGEVLEHVADIHLFLRGCSQLLTRSGRLCVTVPNACSPKIGLRSLAGRESVHPDHRVYFGPRTLQQTLECAGFAIEAMASYLAPFPGPAGRLVLNPALQLCHRVFQGPVGDGLIAVARYGPRGA